MKQPQFTVTFYLEGAVRQLRTVERGVNSPSTKTELGIFAGQSGLNSHDVSTEPTQCTITREIGPDVYNPPIGKRGEGMPSRTWCRNNLGANPKTWSAKVKALSPEAKCDAWASDYAHNIQANSWVITEMPE